MPGLNCKKSDSAVKGNVGITTMVAKPGHSTSTLGSWGLTVLKGSKHVDASIEAIRFLTTDAAQKQLYLQYGYTPTQQAVFNDPLLLKESPILADFEKALKVVEPRPETPLYAQISDVLQRQLSSILTHEQIPQAGLDVATHNTRQILISAGDQP